ncbi:MAG: hypothetical protein ACRC1K_09880 [Planctomycetia bacterium]
MRTFTSFTLALLLAGWASREAVALGSDHPKEHLVTQGLNCVHGFFVNASDVFFFAGDAADFNKATAELAKKKTKVRVVVHKGAKRARSPWDKADRDVSVDWSVTTGPMAHGPQAKGEGELVRIDLWLGGKVKKDDVKYPPGAEVIPAEELENENGDPGSEKK